MKNYFQNSLGVRGILFFCSCLLIILSAMTITNVLYQRDKFEKMGNAHVQELGQLVLTAMRNPMLNGDQDVIQKQFDGYRSLPGLVVAHLTDKHGIIRRSTDLSLIGHKPILSQLDSALQGKEFHSVQVRLRTGRKIVTDLVPILNERMCRSCHGSEDKVLGVLRLGIDWESTAKNIDASRDWNVFLSLVGLVMMSVMIAVFFFKAIIFPLRKLETGMQKVSQGDLSLAIEVHTKDEIGDLTRLFNKMTMDLKLLMDEKERRNKEVALLNKNLVQEMDLRNRMEMNLISSRHRLEDIINFLPDATFAVDTEGKIITWNKAMEAMTGHSAVDVVGKGNQEYSLFFYGERRLMLIDAALNPLADGIEKAYPGIQRHGNTVTSETFAPLLNSGQGAHLWVIATTLMDPKGNVVGAIESVRDITERKKMEIALQESEHFFVSTLNDMYTFVGVLSPDGEVIFANNTPLKASGQTLDEVKGKKFYGLTWWIYSDEVRESIKKDIEFCALGNSTSREVKVQTLNGLIWIDFSIHPIYDEKGNVKYLVPEGRDISKRKKVEEALAESEKRFLDVIYSSKDAILLIDGSIFVDCNEATAQMLGYSTRKEFLMTHPSKLSPQKQPDGRESFEKAEEMMRIASEKGSNRFEWIHRKANGEDFPVEVSLTPIALKGRNVIYCVWRDITDRKIAENALTLKTILLEANLETTIDGVLAVDDTKHTMFFNKRFCDLWKIPQAILEEKDDAKMLECIFVQLKDPVEFKRRVGWLYEHRDEKSQDEIEFADGRCYDRYSSPLWSAAGKYYGRIWYFRDITARKNAELELKNANDKLKNAQAQLLQASKMASIGVLAGGVAHEINNPLTGILNNVQLIKLTAEHKKDFNLADFKELMDVIEESSLRCTMITKSLLEFSRASTENRHDINLNEVLDKVFGLIEKEMRLNNILIRKELDPALPVVNGELQLFQQVIFDIISNAKWAIQSKKDPNGGMITIKTEYDSGKHSVNLFISDTGIGIGKKNLERIFEPFFTTKPVGQGTGLGLAIVYNIIKEHNGTIEVQSEVGQGTCFKITLPVLGA
jgi:PAS domain S-box-containing protein